MLSPKDQHFQQDPADLDPLELRLPPVYREFQDLQHRQFHPVFQVGQASLVVLVFLVPL